MRAYEECARERERGHLLVVLCYMYCSLPSEHSYTLGWQEEGGQGQINGSDRFTTRGAPPILNSTPRP